MIYVHSSIDQVIQYTWSLIWGRRKKERRDPDQISPSEKALSISRGGPMVPGCVAEMEPSESEPSVWGSILVTSRPIAAWRPQPPSIMDAPKVRQPPLLLLFWGWAPVLLSGKVAHLFSWGACSCFALRGLFGIWLLVTCRGPPRHIMQCRLEDRQRQIRLWLSRGDFRSGKNKGSQKSLWEGSEIGWLWGRAGPHNEEAPPACCTAR